MRDEELEKYVEGAYDAGWLHFPIDPQGWMPDEDKAAFKEAIREALRAVRLETARAAAEECKAQSAKHRADHDELPIHDLDSRNIALAQALGALECASAIRARFGVEP